MRTLCLNVFKQFIIDTEDTKKTQIQFLEVKNAPYKVYSRRDSARVARGKGERNLETATGTTQEAERNDNDRTKHLERWDIVT